MIGRQDTVPVECPDCKGSRKDPNNRKRPCRRCSGAGWVERCETCGEIMPCGGTVKNKFDQSHCSYRRRNSEAYKKDVPKKPPITSFLGAISDIVHVDIGEVKTKKSILAKDDEKLGD